MIKLIYILLFLPLTVMGQMNSTGSPYRSTAAHTEPAGPTMVWTDNFDGYNHANALHGQGDWLREVSGNDINAYNSTETYIYSASSSARTGAYNSNALNDNQYVECVVRELSSGGGTGPAVRMSGGSGTYYGIHSTTGSSLLVRMVADVSTTLATGDAWSVDDVIRLEGAFMLMMFLILRLMAMAYMMMVALKIR